MEYEGEMSSSGFCAESFPDRGRNDWTEGREDSRPSLLSSRPRVPGTWEKFLAKLIRDPLVYPWPLVRSTESRSDAPTFLPWEND